ncbi:MAG: DHH family phosphoesterase [Proteobacteria bacterium]|nr:DHH family phosphoesterase [Pseudomonadota bacterium]
MAADPFLSYIRTIKSQASQAGLIVLGNQGADLDSIASALVLAWHLATQQPKKTPVAVIAIPRHELNLRPEALFILAECGINPEDLLFSDDVDLDELLRQGAELVLVDHNSLNPSFITAEPGVASIFDHHHDAGEFLNAEPRLIDKVGSTATLVAEFVLQDKGEITANGALLLSGALLLDTVNLSAKAGRSTGRDKEMAIKLLGICGRDQDTFFHTLQKAQDDLSGLTSKDLLARDYKEWQSPFGPYGISTVLLALASWQQRETDLASVIAHFATHKKVPVFIVMMASHTPDFKRELILFCQHKELHTGLISYLDNQDLHLVATHKTLETTDHSGFLTMYNQGNVAISRKRLQPLVHTYLSSLLR